MLNGMSPPRLSLSEPEAVGAPEPLLPHSSWAALEAKFRQEQGQQQVSSPPVRSLPAQEQAQAGGNTPIATAVTR